MPSSLHKLGVQLESRNDTANIFWDVWVKTYHIMMERDREQSSFSTRIGSYTTRKDPHIEIWWDINVCEDPRFVIFITPDSSRDDWAYYVLFDDAHGLNRCKICFQTKKLNFTTSPSRCKNRYATFRPYPAHLHSSYSELQFQRVPLPVISKIISPLGVITPATHV